MKLFFLALLCATASSQTQNQRLPDSRLQSNLSSSNNQLNSSLDFNATDLQQYGTSGQVQRTNQQGTVSSYQETQFNNQRNSSAKLQQYSFNNGQCYYEDGGVVENGRRRELTSDELNRLTLFEQNMANYSKQISSSLGDWVRSLLQWDPVDDHDSSFPNFSPFPTMPTVPCFCTSCNQTQS